MILIVGFRVPMPGCYFETLGRNAYFLFCVQPALLKYVLSIQVIVIIILLDKEQTKNNVALA